MDRSYLERQCLKLKSTQSSEKRTARKPKSRLRENVEAIAIAVILALFIRTFVVQAFKIPSGSMKDTLLIGDHILVNKFIYGIKIPFTQMTLIPISHPDRGDIVVFRYPEDPSKDFIKRVVGVSGDVIEVKHKKVFVNHKPADESHIKHMDLHEFPKQFSHRDNFGPVTVPENALFVMGDNRDNSHDSRFWGFVGLPALKGKAFIIYWSWDKEKFGVRWNRLGHLLH